MARATKNSISGGRLESEPRMMGLLPSPRRCSRTQHDGRCSAIGANASSKSEGAVVDRMRAMRRAGESYSEVILRLAGEGKL
jgi:hypothetical protein